MSYLENARDFRLEAKARGLVLDKYDDDTPRWIFDLNSGPIVVEPRNHENLWELVKLAREYAFSGNYGQHIALFNLLTHKDKLDEDYTFWSKNYSLPTRIEII